MEETKGDGTLLVTTRIREEMRLAAVVQHIDHDTNIVPRGTYRKVRNARGRGTRAEFFFFCAVKMLFSPGYASTHETTSSSPIPSPCSLPLLTDARPNDRGEPDV